MYIYIYICICIYIYIYIVAYSIIQYHILLYNILQYNLILPELPRRAARGLALSHSTPLPCIVGCPQAYSGGITCLTLPVQRRFSSKVANHVATYGDP